MRGREKDLSSSFMTPTPVKTGKPIKSEIPAEVLLTTSPVTDIQQMLLSLLQMISLTENRKDNILQILLTPFLVMPMY